MVVVGGDIGDGGGLSDIDIGDGHGDSDIVDGDSYSDIGGGGRDIGEGGNNHLGGDLSHKV